MQRRVMLRYTTLCYVTFHQTLLCNDALLYVALLCSVALCYVTLHYVALLYVTYAAYLRVTAGYVTSHHAMFTARYVALLCIALRYFALLDVSHHVMSHMKS